MFARVKSFIALTHQLHKVLEEETVRVTKNLLAQSMGIVRNADDIMAIGHFFRSSVNVMHICKKLFNAILQVFFKQKYSCKLHNFSRKWGNKEKLITTNLWKQENNARMNVKKEH